MASTVELMVTSLDGVGCSVSCCVVGVSAVIPAIGAQYGPVFTELQTGGISAIMWTVGVEVR